MNFNYLETYMTMLLFVATPLFLSVTPMQFAIVAGLFAPLLFVTIILVDSVITDYKALRKVTK